LREEVKGIEDPTTGKQGRFSGTSIATSIAAAIAARVIDFSRHEDCKRIPSALRERLKTVDGMSAVFRKMANEEPSNGYDCVAPWRVLDYSESDAEDLNNATKRERICHRILIALEGINRN
jgi:hypothetical protein